MFRLGNLDRLVFLLATGLFAHSSMVFAAPEVELFIKDHKFNPSQLTLPAGEKIKLIIHNQDGTPEEFESYDLHREKIIPGNKKAVIFIGPLKPGTYSFFGEFNPKTAQGVITVQ